MEPLITLLDRARAMSLAHGRSDMAARCEQARRRVLDPHVRVLVVGEFKQGKSQLVDALVNAPVCPVDDDVATSVPTAVSHGEVPAAALVLTSAADSGPDSVTRVPVPVESLREHVSEHGNPDNRRRLACAEVRLPRELLADGLVLVDTPGVGGLGSSHTTSTLTALATADAVLVVSDASEEYSAPELEFLHQAMRLCPNVACVLTKTDLYPQWREVADLDRRHLAAAGLAVRLMPVSSTLRLHAARRRDRELNEESGFPDLVRHLRDDVVGKAGLLSRRSVTHDVMTVTEHLLMAARSELSTLEEPARSEEIVDGLVQARQHAAELKRRSARWQQTLADGVADLTADIEYDLRDRLRKITREAEESIDQQDPGEVWEEFDAWLAQRISSAVATNFVWAHERAQWLAALVGDQFGAQGRGSMPALLEGDTTEALDLVARLERVEAEHLGAGQKTLIALKGSYGGVLMFGMVTAIALGMSLINPISVGIGVLMGGKAYRDERRTRLSRRRTDAKAAVRRHVEDVVFQVGKDTRDRLRTVQRVLRDHFTTTAEELYRSLDDSVRSSRQAVVGRPADRDSRLLALRERVAELEELQAAARALGTSAQPGRSAVPA